jgi:hypothetical protein
MFRRAALLLTLAALFSPTDASARVDCGSGHTEFRDGPTRIFSTRHESLGSTRRAVSYYVCSARLRRPHRFVSGEDELSEFRRSGPRVGFARTWTEGVASGWNAGWVDIRTGRERDREISSNDGDTDIPSGAPQAVAVGGSGALAFLQGHRHGQLIGYLPLRGSPRVVATATGVLPGSLALAHGRITWVTRSGERGSAPAG